ncbi:MAG: PaaI family thioesterase [Paraburkholderia fungorum]|nr:PaaI family thioesterase [Paraburkholderia fungorum]
MELEPLASLNNMESDNTIPFMAHIPDSLFAERIRASFMRQNAMTLIQATMPVVEHGHTEIHLPVWNGVEQQHGFVHGGVVGMIADSAGGYAAMTLVPASASVLTVEYKLNLLAAADGNSLIARGRVVRPGRTLIVTQAEVFAVKGGDETLCALMQQTIMVMHGKVEK